MILNLVLLLGAVLWIAGEAMGFVAGGIGVADGWIACLGMTLAGAAIWCLKDLPDMGKPGRVGIVLVAFGCFVFAMGNIIMLTSGTLGELAADPAALEAGGTSYMAVVFTPLYFLGLVFVVSGLFAFALHFSRARGELLVAVIFALLGLIHFIRLPYALIAPLDQRYHIAASLLLAAALAGLALMRLRLRRKAQSV